MSRRSNQIAVAALAVVALLVGLFVAFDRGGDPRRVGRGSADVGADRAPRGPVDLAASAFDRPAPDGAESASPRLAEADAAPEREALGPDPAEPVPVFRPVRGQVVDEFGAPVAGEWVLWVQPAPENTPWSPFDDRPALYAQTDATGWFSFAAHHGDARLGGVLQYGIALFAGATPSCPVDTEGRDHFLQHPTRGANVPALVVELVDARDGAPLTAFDFDLRLVRPSEVPVDPTLPESITSRGSWRVEPHPATVLRQFGLVRVERLAPGTWRLFVRDRTSLGHTRDVVLPLTGDDVVVRVELDVLDGDWLAGADLAAGSLAVPAPGSGFDQLVPEVEKRRDVGATDSNRHFVHTLRGFGSGPFDGAYLELELEAVPDACDNDTLSLEFADGGFAWGLDLASLTGAPWSLGTRTHLVLDLANLPGGPRPIDLRAALDDGALDVYVQDDTAVHAVRLHVRPAR